MRLWLWLWVSPFFGDESSPATRRLRRNAHQSPPNLWSNHVKPVTLVNYFTAGKLNSGRTWLRTYHKIIYHARHQQYLHKYGTNMLGFETHQRLDLSSKRWRFLRPPAASKARRCAAARSPRRSKLIQRIFARVDMATEVVWVQFLCEVGWDFVVKNS